MLTIAARSGIVVCREFVTFLQTRNGGHLSKYQVTTGHYETPVNQPYSFSGMSYSPTGSYGKTIEADEFKITSGSLAFSLEGKLVAYFSTGNWLTFELIPEPKPSPAVTEETLTRILDERTIKSSSQAQTSTISGMEVSFDDRVKRLIKPRALR